MTLNRLILFLLVFAIILGCSESDFEIESHNLPEHPTLEASELFRLNSPAEGAFFSYIRKIHVLSDGNLVVQNYPDHQLYELSKGGDLIGVIGRQGRGPGEFIETYISHLADDDSLHVFDFNNSRHQIFSRDEPGQWRYSRESEFRPMAIEGLKAQIPERVVQSTEDGLVGLFRIHPGSRDTLQSQYVYVSEVDQDIAQSGEVSRLRPASDLAIHRGENNSMSVFNNRRFYNAFYHYRPETDEVILVKNTSNEIISIDSSENESVKGYLPYDRFPINREKLDSSMSNVNHFYSGMEEIVQRKLLEHEPYYWNVILHDDRLWVNMAQSDSSKQNWIITKLDGEVLESFHGPDQISEVTIHENNLYGSVTGEDGEVWLVGYEIE